MPGEQEANANVVSVRCEHINGIKGSWGMDADLNMSIDLKINCKMPPADFAKIMAMVQAKVPMFIIVGTLQLAMKSMPEGEKEAATAGISS